MKPFDSLPAFQLPNPWELSCEQLLEWNAKLWDWEARTVADATVSAMATLIPQAQSMGLNVDRLGLAKLSASGGWLDEPKLKRVDAKGNRSAIRSTDDNDYICDMVVEALKDEVLPSTPSDRLLAALNERLAKHVFEPGQTSAWTAEVSEPLKEAYVTLPAGSQEVEETSILLCVVAFEKLLEQLPEGYRVMGALCPRSTGGRGVHWVVVSDGQPLSADKLPDRWLEASRHECTVEGPSRVAHELKAPLAAFTKELLNQNEDAQSVLMKAWSIVDSEELPQPEMPQMGPPSASKSQTPPPAPLPQGNPTGLAARGCLHEFLLDQHRAQAKAMLMETRLEAGSIPRGPRL